MNDEFAGRGACETGATDASALRETPIDAWMSNDLHSADRFYRMVHIRDLIAELVSRDMKVRYKRTVLGTFWSLLNPLAQVVVLSFVFRRVLPLGVPHYTAFLFTGLTAWNWFQTALMSATEAITDNPDLIRRPRFPIAVLPAVPIASQFIHFLLALIVLIAYLLTTGTGRPLSGAVFVLPIIAALQFCLTLGFAYLTATLHVMFRDTKYLVSVALLILFYLLPILYPASNVPTPYRAVYNLDPLVGLINAYRAILLDARTPDVASLGPAVICTVLSLLIGRIVFNQARTRFIEEL